MVGPLASFFRWDDTFACEAAMRGVPAQAAPSDDSESFRDAFLEGSDFSHAFVVANYSRARLRDCRFFEANVKTCSFDDVDRSPRLHLLRSSNRCGHVSFGPLGGSRFLRGIRTELFDEAGRGAGLVA